MKPGISVAFALALTLAAGSAWAHHSSAVFFDLDPAKRVTLTGMLTKVDWRNPHIQFFLDVKDDKGQADSWSIQAEPPGILANHNIGRAIFEKAIGQTVTVEVSPARNGSRSGEMQKITFPDGTKCCSQP